MTVLLATAFTAQLVEYITLDSQGAGFGSQRRSSSRIFSKCGVLPLENLLSLTVILTPFSVIECKCPVFLLWSGTVLWMGCYSMWNDIVLYDVVWYMIWYGVVNGIWYGMVWHGIMWYGVICLLYGMFVMASMVWHAVVLYCMGLHDIAFHNTTGSCKLNNLVTWLLLLWLVLNA